MDNNNPSRRTRRMAFIISGSTDALLGAILLLIGFRWLPVDIAQYGFENWHVILLGVVLLVTGAAFVAYNLSRLDE